YSLTVTPCTAVVARTTAASPQAPGASITFAAYASRCPGAVFRFWLQAKGGPWTIKQDYGSNTWVWDTNGFAPGTYEVGVGAWAKSSSSSRTYDAYFIRTYRLDVGRCTAVSMTSSPPAPQTAGTSITFIASATGCTAPDYQFWELSPSGTSWQVARPYGSGATFAWNTTGKSGPYRLGVWARQAGSTAGYDAYAIETFWLVD